ncbi:hypothetical protein HanPSC8_Chr02g0071321 [Helianthus annuus]|nr:hypothetical protein HanIR_Chr02g0086381 [Helianthus annuus]KAJ0952358.1 hypothetical protein HanPSC8_Chr02g0071321 [Helianthus annuus]
MATPVCGLEFLVLTDHPSFIRCVLFHRVTGLSLIVVVSSDCGSKAVNGFGLGSGFGSTRCNSGQFRVLVWVESSQRTRFGSAAVKQVKDGQLRTGKV